MTGNLGERASATLEISRSVGVVPQHTDRVHINAPNIRTLSTLRAPSPPHVPRPRGQGMMFLALEGGTGLFVAFVWEGGG